MDEEPIVAESGRSAQGAGCRQLEPWAINGIFAIPQTGRQYWIRVDQRGEFIRRPWSLRLGRRRYGEFGTTGHWTDEMAAMYVPVGDAPVVAELARDIPAPTGSIEDLKRWRDAQAWTENAQNHGKVFMGFPDRWLESPKYRCVGGHVSRHVLKSEEQGDRCLACGGPVLLTLPEDREVDDG